VGASVRGQAAGTTTETVSLGTVFATMAVFAEKLLLVLRAVGRVQGLVAHA